MRSSVRNGIAPGAHIEKITPYVPGKPVEELERERGIKNAVKLASNENPLGPSSKAMAVLKKGLGVVRLQRYPESTGPLLREAIAKRFKVGPDLVILGNGSDEVMDLVAKAFLNPGQEALMADETFSIYEIVVRAHHGVPVKVPLIEGRHDLDGFHRRINANTRLVFLCSPNNPTGTIIPRLELDRFLDRLPDSAVVVVDEAYAEYADDPEFPDTADWIRAGRPVVMLRTFSKIYGLAGLRIGYGIGTAETVGYLNRVRLPFNTNLLAQRAALAALGDEKHLDRSRRLNRAGKAYLYRELDRLGIRYFPSQANFIYMDLSSVVGRNGGNVYDALLDQGVIIRPVKNGRFRVSIGLQKENERFVKALVRAIGRAF